MSTSGDENVAPEYDLKRLKNSKAQIKGELTRFVTFLDKTDLNKSIDILQVRYDSIKYALEKFKSVQTEYEELLISDFPDNYNLDLLAQERDSFESRYFEALAAARVILDKHYQQQQLSAALASAAAVSAGAGGTPISASSQIGPSQNNAVLPSASAKLPLLTLPEFSGSYADWQRFRDMFTAIVHNNNALSNVQRFYYLEASLKGEPKSIIASLAPTDANYITAWELLEKRYENKKIIINAHLKEIMDLPALNKESHTLLRQFSNTFFKNYRSLESLGENVSEWNTILIYILVSKLDINTKREWEIYCKAIISPKIDDFTEFLTQRC